MTQQVPPIDWFRSIAPYVKNHRDRTFVVYLGDGLLAHPLLVSLIHDIALLQTLGVRLVLIHATRSGIEQALLDRGIQSALHDGVRVTDDDAIIAVRDVAGAQRAHLESLLSMGLPNSPMRGARLRVISGNFVTARPVGVVDGVDYQFTGAVRRIDAPGITAALASDAIVLLSPLGFSPAGELFNLSSEDLATATAVSLGADKLIMLQHGGGLRDDRQQPINQCTVTEALALTHLSPEQAAARDAACTACSNGVARAHLIDFDRDGALLEELFTVDGAGTLVSEQDYEQVRPATMEHLAGVIELIEPLENAGVLVQRSRERLEQEIGHFRVLERDGQVIACAALYPFAEFGCGEIACIATHPDYRNGGRGERLLHLLSREARELGLSRVFVLTTQTSHWFLEQGFQETGPESLPEARKVAYNQQRNAKVFERHLTP